MVLVLILVSLRQRGAPDQSVVGDRLHSVHQKQRVVSEVRTHDPSNVQFQKGGFLDGYCLPVRAHLSISFPGVSRATVEDSPLQVTFIASNIIIIIIIISSSIRHLTNEDSVL